MASHVLGIHLYPKTKNTKNKSECETCIWIYIYILYNLYSILNILRLSSHHQPIPTSWQSIATFSLFPTNLSNIIKHTHHPKRRNKHIKQNKTKQNQNQNQNQHQKPKPNQKPKPTPKTKNQKAKNPKSQSPWPIITTSKPGRSCINKLGAKRIKATIAMSTVVSGGPLVPAASGSRNPKIRKTVLPPVNQLQYLKKLMANRPYILVYKDPLHPPSFWYRQAIYFDLKVKQIAMKNLTIFAGRYHQNWVDIN